MIEMAKVLLPIPDDAVGSKKAKGHLTTTSEPIDTPKPAYPREALAEHRQAVVWLVFMVNSDGHVSDIHILNTVTDGRLAASAVSAASTWRFKPASQHDLGR